MSQEPSELTQLDAPIKFEAFPHDPEHRYFIDGKWIILSAGQIEAVEAIEQGHNVFLTGEPGTGKSVVTKVLRKLAKKWDKSVAFLAPTGIAALQIGGSTIHRFFKFPTKPLAPDFGDAFGKSYRMRDLMAATDIIVLDEGSMIRSDMFTAIYRTCQAAAGNLKPFGGKQVIVVADFFQLPAVVEFVVNLRTARQLGATVPQALLDQLKIGGRLAAIVGDEPVMRASVYTRTGEREFGHVEVFDTVAPRLLGFDEPPRFRF